MFNFSGHQRMSTWGIETKGGQKSQLSLSFWPVTEANIHTKLDERNIFSKNLKKGGHETLWRKWFGLFIPFHFFQLFLCRFFLRLFLGDRLPFLLVFDTRQKVHWEPKTLRGEKNGRSECGMKRALDKKRVQSLFYFVDGLIFVCGAAGTSNKIWFKVRNGRVFNGFLSNCWWVGESTNNLKRIPTAKMDLFLLNFGHSQYPWWMLSRPQFLARLFPFSSFPHTQQTLTTWPFRWEALTLGIHVQLIAARRPRRS